MSSPPSSQTPLAGLTRHLPPTSRLTYPIGTDTCAVVYAVQYYLHSAALHPIPIGSVGDPHSELAAAEAAAAAGLGGGLMPQHDAAATRPASLRPPAPPPRASVEDAGFGAPSYNQLFLYGDYVASCNAYLDLCSFLCCSYLV